MLVLEDSLLAVSETDLMSVTYGQPGPGLGAEDSKNGFAHPAGVYMQEEEPAALKKKSYPL